MILSLIVAMTDERVIGKDNGLPWHIPEDLKRFKTITMGHALIMGRRTFASIGRPLPGRQNIVLSRSDFHAPGTETAGDLEAALAMVEPGREAFVIGGAGVFAEALPRAERLYLTLIHHPFPGDVFFPPFDLAQGFSVTERVAARSASGLSYTNVVAVRV